MRPHISALSIVFAILLALSVLPASAAKQSAISIEEATKIARDHVKGEVIKVEREQGLYEVKVLTTDGKPVKLYIDAATGKVVRKGKRRISLDTAISIAKKAVSGEVVKAELERGRYEVKIRLENGRIAELYIDATTGEIIKSKKERFRYEGSGRGFYRNDYDD